MVKSARDEIFAAMSESDPITAMRALAIDLAARGLSQPEVEGAFNAVASDLYEAGREEEAGCVAEVIDMMAEWYADGRPID
jgi:hypothetical protein